MTSKAIGIDLGTTYSCVAVFQHFKVDVIANDHGNRTTPSYVAFNDELQLVGEAAKYQLATNASNTVVDAKRLIGRKFNDSLVTSDRKHWPFEVISDEGKPKIKVVHKGESKSFYPEEISSMILRKMKKTAEAYLGVSVKDAVITVPAYFTDSQRQATRDAGTIAGLNVLRIVNEPTAAALAFGLDRNLEKEITILVFDLGGGTFDVSLLKNSRGVCKVKATAGDTHLGGNDFDARMVDYFVTEFKKKYGKDLSENKRSLRRLRTACEIAKRTLSSSTEAPIAIEALYDGIDFFTSISRARFEDLSDDLFLLTLELVKNCLKDASVEKTEIDDIVLVGGSTRIPKIQKLLKTFFDEKELDMSVNPDEAVASGAAILAAILNGDKSENAQNILLLDVTPLSLGIEVQDGDEMNQMSTVVKRHTPVPAKQINKDYTTKDDNQTSVAINIYEGERSLVTDNHFLGHFLLEGISCAPKGVPKIEVTFEIDSNGILSVSAVEKLSGSLNKMTIKNDKGRLCKKEIERMIQEADLFEAANEKNRQCSAAKNSLESYCFNMKSTFQDNKFKDRLSEDERGEILKVCTEGIVWLYCNSSASKEKFELKHKEIEQVCLPILNKVYQSVDSGPIEDLKKEIS